MTQLGLNPLEASSSRHLSSLPREAEDDLASELGRALVTPIAGGTDRNRHPVYESVSVSATTQADRAPVWAMAAMASEHENWAAQRPENPMSSLGLGVDYKYCKADASLKWTIKYLHGL